VNKQNAPDNYVFYRNQKWRYPKITHGKGIYLYDNQGREYIDGCSGAAVANIGHGNKEVADFAGKQIKKIAFTHLSRWTVDTIEQCAERIIQRTPGDLNHVYFLSGGSESTETAAKLARQYFVERDGPQSSKWKIISKGNSFHGNTLGALSMTGFIPRRRIYTPMLIDFPKIPQFYHYRNQWHCNTLKETSIKAAEALEAEIKKQGADTVAAFISEPVVGMAAPGSHPEPVYFQMVRDICDRYDVLLIIDEVMSGFGRTGKWFGIDHFGITPDIMAAAKGMSAGYTPIGAAVSNNKVFNTIMRKGSGSFVHGHTYAGNPLSCGIACKVIEIIERENIVENSKKQGARLMKKLQALYSYPIVGDIRGKGLMIGIELVKDQKSKTPFEPNAMAKNKVTEYALDAGLVLLSEGGVVDGIRGDHFLVAPPLNITGEEIDLLYERLETGIQKAAEALSQFIN
jgi:adenosylmethionine-8-amino-7-oxononanoate aminotransferase